MAIIQTAILKSRKQLIFALYLLVVLLVYGCEGSTDKEDIHSFVEKTKNLARQKIDPLPRDQLNRKIDYVGIDKRSPFVTPEEYIMGQISNIDLIQSPDLNRSKGYLEKFDLNSLKMVGTLKKSDGTNWALISDKDGIIHKVQEGSYVGNNFGKIMKVDLKGIEIKESISNGVGTWKSKTIIMKLQE